MANRITDETKIRAHIRMVQQKGKGLDALIQVTALNSLAHGQIHGDFSLFGALLKAMPKGSRVASLKDWVLTTFPLIFSKEGKVSIDHGKTRKGEFPVDRAAWDLDALAATNWFDHESDKKELTFTAEQLIAYLAKLAEGKKKGADEDAMDFGTVALKAVQAEQAKLAKARADAAKAAAPKVPKARKPAAAKTPVTA